MFKILAPKKSYKKCAKLWKNTTAPHQKRKRRGLICFPLYSKLLTRCCDYFSNTKFQLCIALNHPLKNDDAINETNLRESSYLFVECLQSNNSKNSRMPAEICSPLLFNRVCSNRHHTPNLYPGCWKQLLLLPGLFHRPSLCFRALEKRV